MKQGCQTRVGGQGGTEAEVLRVVDGQERREMSGWVSGQIEMQGAAARKRGSLPPLQARERPVWLEPGVRQVVGHKATKKVGPTWSQSS